MQNTNTLIASALRSTNALKDAITAENTTALDATRKDIDRVLVLLSRISMSVILYNNPDPFTAPAPAPAPVPAPAPTTNPINVRPITPTPTTPALVPVYHKSTGPSTTTPIVIDEENTKKLNRRCRILIDAMKRLPTPATEKELKTFLKAAPDLYNSFMSNDRGEPYKCSYYEAFRGHMEILYKSGAVKPSPVL